MRPTSCATSNGTGMSSPTHDGTSPISRTGSTSRWSSLKSTNRQAEPRMMKLSPSFAFSATRSEEHTSELQSLTNLVCRLLLEKKKKKKKQTKKKQTNHIANNRHLMIT